MLSPQPCPRTGTSAARTSSSVALFALVSAAVLTAAPVRAEDVLLDLPAPRAVSGKPVTDASSRPERVAPPPATVVAPGSAPATIMVDDATVTAGQPGASAVQKTGKGKPQPTPSNAKSAATANKPTSGKATSGKPTASKAKDDKNAAKNKQETNDCCGRPGMIPVCRCVPITKKKKHTEYDKKCELVCVPGCGLLHGGHGAGHAPGCCDDGCPSCADIRIRHRYTLQKRVTDKEYDSYEFKIEWVPASCAFGGCTDCARGDHGGHGFLYWLLRHE